jgi:sphingomyelin phosphodiesterase acid-like 3
MILHRSNNEEKTRWQLLILLLLCHLFYSYANELTKFLWVTDIHYDPFYDGTINSTFHCRRDLWHSAMRNQPPSFIQNWSKRSVFKILSPGQNAKYGRFGCDAPKELFLSSLQHMKTTNAKPSFLVVSGDLLAHRLPNSTIALQTMSYVVNQIAKTYPGIITIPCIGNNDLFPDYYLPFDNSTWLESLYEIWKIWLPEEHQKLSFIKGGYFYNDVIPGLRVIVLNSMYYSPKRWPEVKVLPQDPSNQFQWFSDQLSIVRQKRMQVIIVTHIPPSQNAYDSKLLWIEQYLEKYLAIVEQYDDVIIGQLYGHLHTDEFRVQLKPIEKVESRVNVVNGIPVTFGMIGSSISPVFSNNAAYREFMLSKDLDKYKIGGYKQYYMDIFNSNKLSKEVWAFEYDYNVAYNQNGMDAKSMYNLIQSMSANPELLTDYIRRQEALYTPDRYKFFCEFSHLTRESYETCMENGSNDGV